MDTCPIFQITFQITFRFNFTKNTYLSCYFSLVWTSHLVWIYDNESWTSLILPLKSKVFAYVFEHNAAVELNLRKTFYHTCCTWWKINVCSCNAVSICCIDETLSDTYHNVSLLFQLLKLDFGISFWGEIEKNFSEANCLLRPCCVLYGVSLDQIYGWITSGIDRTGMFLLALHPLLLLVVTFLDVATGFLLGLSFFWGDSVLRGRPLFLATGCFEASTQTIDRLYS